MNMKFSEFSCSLEKMIGFIADTNEVEALQFTVYENYEEGYFKEKSIEKNRLLVEFRDIGALSKIADFAAFFEKKPADHLGIASLVKIKNGGMRHIPMIDFNCGYTIENLLKIEKTLHVLGQSKGFLLESGKSYHYYGIELLSVEGWVNFTKSCAGQDIIGKYWPAFQLKRGYSTLRISTSLQKPHLPKVVAKEVRTMSSEKMANYLIQFKWKNPWGNEPGTGPPACWKDWILLKEVKNEEEAIKKGKEHFNAKRIALGGCWESLLGFRVSKIIEEQECVRERLIKEK